MAPAKFLAFTVNLVFFWYVIGKIRKPMLKLRTNRRDTLYLITIYRQCDLNSSCSKVSSPKHFPLKYRKTVNYMWNISIKLCKPCEIRTNDCIMWWIVRTHFPTLFKSLFYLNNKFTLSREMLVCEKYAPPEKIAPFCWLFGEFLQKFWFPGTKVLHKKGYFFWSTGLANISFKYSKNGILLPKLFWPTYCEKKLF